MLKKRLSSKLFKYYFIPSNIFNPVLRSMIFQSRKKFSESEIQSIETTKKCIDKGIAWILYLQSLQKDGGSTGFVFFEHGRKIISGSYPETTGYTIITLLDYDELYKSKPAYDSAFKMAEFLLKIQNADGSFIGGTMDFPTGPSVFNSAQIIDGLLRAYEVSGSQKYLESATAACRWIASVQEPEGCWNRFNFLGMKRVYDTKVSQALLKADKLGGTDEFSEAVSRNLDWVISNQNENGWFNNCDNSFECNTVPLTHTIGYTIHGLIECYQIRKNKAWLDAAVKPLQQLITQFKPEKETLESRYQSNWRPATTSSCITGDAQISLCWLSLYQILGDRRWLDAALRLNKFLKTIQIESPYKELAGAFPSSYPVYGAYHPFAITNWTVKYCLDAFIAEYKIMKDLPH